jgi:2-C-methyl-D-erythritol 4-phosphate cytidylyltransferase
MARAMIIVGGGSSTRFGADKLLADIDGLPLVAYTIDAVASHVDRCVVVCREETVDEVRTLRPDVIVTAGGSTRTLSEMAGLAALGGEEDLIGIHDAARPAVKGEVIDRLFDLAARYGGAIPVLTPDHLVLDRKTHEPIGGLRRAQTPQVFRGAELMAAYVKAAQAGYDGQDTSEVVERFGNVTIAVVAGDAANVKVTYPEDVETARDAIRGRSRT